MFFKEIGEITREVDITKPGETTNEKYKLTVELYGNNNHLCIVIFEKGTKGMMSMEINLGLTKNKQQHLNNLNAIFKVFGFEIK